jgi:hypothetical protein
MAPQLVMCHLVLPCLQYTLCVYLGEKVTQLQHAQQAAQQAKEAGQPDHVILACFLHDIGHLVGLEKNMEQVVPVVPNQGFLKQYSMFG